MLNQWSITTKNYFSDRREIENSFPVHIFTTSSAELQTSHTLILKRCEKSSLSIRPRGNHFLKHQILKIPNEIFSQKIMKWEVLLFLSRISNLTILLFLFKKLCTYILIGYYTLVNSQLALSLAMLLGLMHGE